MPYRDDHDQNYYPLELGSIALQEAILGVDHYILRLEGKVREQAEEIKKLKEQVSNNLHEKINASRALIGQHLTSILDHAEGKPPISDSTGLDAYLILMHIDSILSKVDDEKLDTVCDMHQHSLDGIIDAMDETKQYVAEALTKVKALPR